MFGTEGWIVTQRNNDVRQMAFIRTRMIRSRSDNETANNNFLYSQIFKVSVCLKLGNLQIINPGIKKLKSKKDLFHKLHKLFFASPTVNISVNTERNPRTNLISHNNIMPYRSLSGSLFVYRLYHTNR